MRVVLCWKIFTPRLHHGAESPFLGPFARPENYASPIVRSARWLRPNCLVRARRSTASSARNPRRSSLGAQPKQTTEIRLGSAGQFADRSSRMHPEHNTTHPPSRSGSIFALVAESHRTIVHRVTVSVGRHGAWPGVTPASTSDLRDWRRKFGASAGSPSCSLARWCCRRRNPDDHE